MSNNRFSASSTIGIFILFLLGLAYLFFLASSIQMDVFYSGDGGVKYIIIKQINQGHGFKYLHLTQPQWVLQLWENGYFPFKEPFFYKTAQGYMVSFPPAFQMISAFFYEKMGYMGLYVLPFASLILLWLFLIRLLQYLSVPASTIFITLFVLIFCSPLTIYGVTYWEHTTAVLLLFSGLVYILKKNNKVFFALVAGFLSGIAVWLRPEAIVMNFLYVVAIFFYNRERDRRQNIFFVTGMLVPVIAFFVFNQLEYGSLLGVHSYQVLKENTLPHKILRGIKNELLLNWTFFISFPFVIFLLPLLYNWFRKKWILSRELKSLITIAVAFCILSPFIVPNLGGKQWGARYLLPVIPVMVIMFALYYESFRQKLNRNFFLVILVVCIGYSFYYNTIKGGLNHFRNENFTRIKPALDFLEQQKENIVVVNSENIPMELGHLFHDKHFFRAESKGALDSLITALKTQGLNEFLYIAEDNQSPGLPNLFISSQPALVKKGNYYFGKYAVK